MNKVSSRRNERSGGRGVHASAVRADGSSAAPALTLSAAKAQLLHIKRHAGEIDYHTKEAGKALDRIKPMLIGKRVPAHSGADRAGKRGSSLYQINHVELFDGDIECHGLKIVTGGRTGNQSWRLYGVDILKALEGK